MVLDKKVFAYTLLYSFLVIFLIAVFLIPLRVIYQYKDYSYYSSLYYTQDPNYILLIAENVRLLASRGAIPYVIGFCAFIVSMILYLVFCGNGRSTYSISGYIFGLISTGLLIMSVLINMIVYSGRMIDYAVPIITLAISLTMFNVGTLLFLKRNDFEFYVPKYKISIKTKPIKKDFEKIASVDEILKPPTKTMPSKADFSKFFCPYCGSKVEKDHSFCRKCGQPLGEK